MRIILGLDVLDDAKTDAFFDALQAEGVVLDVLVNAAGARLGRVRDDETSDEHQKRRSRRGSWPSTRTRARPSPCSSAAWT